MAGRVIEEIRKGLGKQTECSQWPLTIARLCVHSGQ